MKTQELRAKRANLVSELRAIVDAAEAEKRALTQEEENRWSELNAEVDNLAEQIKREERLAGLEAEHRGTLTEPIRELPLSFIDEQAARRSLPEYSAAFDRFLRQGRNALDAPEVRALQAGVDTEGGYLVPTEFERMLVQALQNQNVMRRLATVIPTSSDRSVPVVTSHGTASWIGEEGTFAESDEAFGLKTLGAHKVGTLIKVSEELLQDSAFNLDAYLASEFARRVGAKEESAFVNGDGVGKPAGIIAGATVGKTAAGATAVTADELIDLYHALPRPYRPRATWLLADSTAKAIRKLKDGDNQYLWQPGLVAGQPDRLFTRPVETSDDVPAMAASARSIAFGDFSYYWIADRQGRAFQRLVELYAATGQVGFRAYQRVDGKLILAEAVQVLQQAAA